MYFLRIWNIIQIFQNHQFAKNVVYYHDIKGDIFIQSQEIKLVLECYNSLLPNVISVWSLGDLINSV